MLSRVIKYSTSHLEADARYEAVVVLRVHCECVRRLSNAVYTHNNTASEA